LTYTVDSKHPFLRKLWHFLCDVTPLIFKVQHESEQWAWCGFYSKHFYRSGLPTA